MKSPIFSRSHAELSSESSIIIRYIFIIKLMKEQGADKEEYWEYEYRLKNNYPFPETIDDMLLWYNGLITSVRTSESRYSSRNEDDTKAALFQLDNHISINNHHAMWFHCVIQNLSYIISTFHSNFINE